ncbi:MAG: hypothetical protein RIR05_100 [Bacteroidota bacterium]
MCLNYFLGDAFQARATPGSLKLGYCCAMNQALRIPIAFNYNGLRLPEGGDFEAIHRVKPSETLIEAQSFI